MQTGFATALTVMPEAFARAIEKIANDNAVVSFFFILWS